MATRNRMPPWHENFKAPSGRELLIRPIRPEDGAPLQGAFALFGPEEVRDRFLQAVDSLSDETVQRLTRKNDDVQRCMMQKGYRYTGTCSGDIASRFPACQSR